ncbi:MAG: urease accessory protein UreD [Pseudomonadota bacterium]
MFADTSRSEPGRMAVDPDTTRANAPTPSLSLARVRVDGGVAVTFANRGGRTIASDYSERDGYKLRTPRGGVMTQAAIINTGGGVAGGDTVGIEVHAEQNAKAAISMPAAEKVYASLGNGMTTVDVSLRLEAASRIDWLPQETIVFNHARLARTISADLAPDARALIAETVVFGRTARGEQVDDCHFQDTWRIRRGGRLFFAENIALSGDVSAQLAKPAVGNGACVMTTLLLASPDASDRIDAVRRALGPTIAGVHTGASAWNDMLVVRLLASKGGPVRALVEQLVPLLSDQPLPRVWAN